MDDLVVWLLAAIDEAERATRVCVDEVGPERAGDPYTDGSGTAEQDAFPSYPWGWGPLNWRTWQAPAIPRTPWRRLPRNGNASTGSGGGTGRRPHRRNRPVVAEVGGPPVRGAGWLAGRMAGVTGG